MIRLKPTALLFMLLYATVQHVFGQASLRSNKQSDSAVANTHVKEIIVIFKTHFDIGYTHRVKDIVHYYRTEMIDHALKIMDSSRSLPVEEQFKWTCPGWVMSKVMEPWPGQTEERRRKLDQAFSNGRFVTHAMPFTIETDVCEPEVLTRGLGFASRLTRQYHLPLPRSAKVTDMPSHSGELATVLGNAGVTFLHIGCNWPSGFVQTPGLFWWEGPDGSRVLTFYSSIYGTTTGLGWPDDWGNGEHFVGRGLLPPADWPYKVWPAIFVTLDNSGPPEEKEVRALFAEARRKLPGVRIRVGTMDDFARDILASRPRLPVVKKEMPDTWIHGMMSDPGGSKLSRASAPLLSADEILNTQLKIWRLPVSSVADSIAEAYESMALYAEHTWGGSASIDQYGEEFKKIPPSAYADLEASWEDKTDYIRHAWNIADHLKSDNLAWLARSVSCGPHSVIVFNPLPWRRNGIVHIKGQSVLVKNVPASGYTTVIMPDEPLTKPSVNNFIENQYYKVTFDASRGTITSLLDKRTGYDWAANVSGIQTGQYCNERFTFEQTAQYTEAYQQRRAWNAFGSKGDWLHPGMHKPGMISDKVVPYRMASPTDGKLSIHVVGGQQTAILEMPADTARHLPASRLTITLVDDQPYIDMEVTILDKAKDNWPEADWLALPFNIKNPVFKVYRSLGIMDPTKDILTGANRQLYSAGQGVTLADSSGNGIAVCPLDHPIISLDTPGCWKFSLDFIPKKPVVYINLYNNQWNTNYRYWYAGTWSSRVRIWTFNSHTPKGGIMTIPALEARYPLQVTAPENNTGKLPAEQKGLELSRKGVLVAAFGEEPDGNRGTLLRLWEMTGVSGDISATLPRDHHFMSATPVNLRGEVVGKRIPIIHGKFDFHMRGFGPASFMLE